MIKGEGPLCPGSDTTDWTVARIAQGTRGYEVQCNVCGRWVKPKPKGLIRQHRSPDLLRVRLGDRVRS